MKLKKTDGNYVILKLRKSDTCDSAIRFEKLYTTTTSTNIENSQAPFDENTNAQERQGIC